MSNGIVTKEPKSKEGTKCRLPIPFVKAVPADIQKMSVENLRRFISFAYESFHKVELPNTVSPTKQPPMWWPTSITFDKTLKLRRGLKSREYQKHLARLVWKFYDFHGFASLLAVSAELSDSRSKRFLLDKTHHNWKVKDLNGRTVIIVDQQSRAYDMNPRVVLEVIQESNRPKVVRQPTQVKKVAPKKRGTKRKLNISSENDEEATTCNYCQKTFAYWEFCMDHEQVCPKGPLKSEPTEMSFFNALGLFGKSDKPKDNASSTPPSGVHVGRTLRKIPKRNQLLSLIRNNPIPITSGPGRRFLTELDEKAEVSYPLHHESYCKPKSGMGMPDPKFATVTKRTILKDGENPHIYTLGKLQRVQRYQELVIGVAEHCWPALNQCKRARLCLERINPNITKNKVVHSVKTTNTSHLQRAFNAAFNFPRIILKDCRKFPIPETSVAGIEAAKLPKGIVVEKSILSAAY